MPAFLLPAITALAAASLWIYLTHWQVYPPLADWGWVALVASLAFGVDWGDWPGAIAILVVFSLGAAGVGRAGSEAPVTLEDR